MNYTLKISSFSGIRLNFFSELGEPVSGGVSFPRLLSIPDFESRLGTGNENANFTASIENSDGMITPHITDMIGSPAVLYKNGESIFTGSVVDVSGGQQLSITVES